MLYTSSSDTTPWPSYSWIHMVHIILSSFRQSSQMRSLNQHIFDCRGRVRFRVLLEGLFIRRVLSVVRTFPTVKKEWCLICSHIAVNITTSYKFGMSFLCLLNGGLHNCRGSLSLVPVIDLLIVIRISALYHQSRTSNCFDAPLMRPSILTDMCYRSRCIGEGPLDRYLLILMEFLKITLFYVI